MKLRVLIVFGLSLGVLVSCCHVPIMNELAIGQSLPADAKASDIAQIIGAASLGDVFHIERNGIFYLVAIDRSGLISYIETRDGSFRTPEGFSVGTSLGELPWDCASKVRKESGWGFFVPLASGWNAVFTQGDSMTEGTLSSEAPIEWFFKRQ